MRPVFLVALLAGGDNELTDQEKKEGWVLLFNGKDGEGWLAGDQTLKAANIEEGAINPFKSGASVVYSKERYGNFVFSCDFKVSPGCNSGVFIRTGNMKDPVQTGIEIQVLDSAGRAKPGKHDCGSIYDLVAPSKNTMKPAGEWNRMEITCDRNKIKVALNGEAVADMDLDQWTKPGEGPDGSKNKFKTALKDFPREGHLGFQDHGKPVWFKNVKIKPIKKVSE
jgi:hypothetical protein